MTFLAYWGIHLFRAYSLPWPRFDLERQRVEESTDPTATAGVAWRIRPVKVNGCVKVARKWQNMAPRFLADSPTLYIYIHTYVDIILHSIIYVYMQQLHITIIIYKGTWWKYKRKHLFKSMHCVENESKVNEVNEQLPYESLYFTMVLCPTESAVFFSRKAMAGGHWTHLPQARSWGQRGRTLRVQWDSPRFQAASTPKVAISCSSIRCNTGLVKWAIFTVYIYGYSAWLNILGIFCLTYNLMMAISCYVRDPDDRHEMEQHDQIRTFRIIQKEQNHSMLNGIQTFVKGILMGFAKPAMLPGTRS